jgi:uncharacterized SAM-binding protein YcdF (DUF218 family)
MIKMILGMSIKKLLLFIFVPVLAVFAAVEIACRLATFNTLTLPHSDNCVVLVPGYPTHDDGTLSPVQRVRVEAGFSAYQKQHCKKIVLSGGAVANPYSEAETMANFAKTLGVPDQDIIVEGRSRNTWENIGCSLTDLKNYSSILITSDILHAKRAKRYLCRQQPSLCSRVMPIGNVLPWRLLWWKVPAAAHELISWLRDWLLFQGQAANKIPYCPSQQVISISE